jgi:hypothetical protein
VAAMPGTLTVADARPAGEAGRRAWRREGRWRVWDPAAPENAAAIEPDLQDAVTVAILARELDLVPAGAEPR